MKEIDLTQAIGSPYTGSIRAGHSVYKWAGWNPSLGPSQGYATRGLYV